MRNPLVLLTLIFGLLGLATNNTQATELKDIKSAIKQGTTKFNFRYRYEFVDQDGISDEAGASTLRGRLTWNSGAVGQWTAGIEADYVALIGDENYNSTENGRISYPVVADPEGFDLNQAFLRYKSEDLTVTTGRQRILQADQRFVGGVGWRQNEQTYDALRAEFKATEILNVDYSYVWNVNRIFGPNDGAQPADWRSNSHLLLATAKLTEDHQLSGFVYLLDFENANGLPNSTETYGLSYKGVLGPIQLAGTYATQSDYGDSPLDFDADFYSISLATQIKPVTLSIGYEVLGSDDGNVGFRSPLATLHKWQGWADKFLLTPASGIEDVYLGVSGKVGKAKFAATYHDYQADEGSADFGNELNLQATFAITDGVSLQLKFAEYDAQDFATDTTKIWFTLIVAL